jgi:hypothetical protein
VHVHLVMVCSAKMALVSASSHAAYTCDSFKVYINCSFLFIDIRVASEVRQVLATYGSVLVKHE